MPSTPHSVDQLGNALSEPSEALIQSLTKLGGDILILGAGGKMGPSLARMARRALKAAGSAARAIAVSRFSNPSVRQELESCGVQLIQGDLLDTSFIDSLPQIENVIFLAGTKFGTTGQEAATWVTNAYVPALVARHFAASRVVALSTGNIYGPVRVETGHGSRETDVPHPVGEYAMSCLARERIFEYFCRKQKTRLATIRLNYATELRYGVLVDLARQVYAGEPINLQVGYVNVIWQADACDWILRSLQHADSPPCYLNVTGPETLSCRQIGEQFGRHFNRSAQFQDTEGPTALLSDATKAVRFYGPPRVGLADMVSWTADWISNGRTTWNKPTRFERLDGRF